MSDTQETKMLTASVEELQLALEALEMARRKCSDDQMKAQLNRGIGAIKRVLGEDVNKSE